MSAKLLVLTMPGFGIETLRHLVGDATWPGRARVQVGLVGVRPTPWHRAAITVRRALQRPDDRLHRLAEGALAASEAEAFLRAEGIDYVWLSDDAAVRAFGIAAAPALTLTITSRVLFSERTLKEPGGIWLNVHPGLLPEYAGASPAPYMFMDGVGGCTIHEMALEVDAGGIVERAPLAEPLAVDGGAYFFDQLPRHTADHIARLLARWRDARGWTVAPAAKPLQHCSSRRLAAERQLDWRCSAERLERWVRALATIAPAWFVDGHGRRVEVMAASALALDDPSAIPDRMLARSQPGSVLARRGRTIEVSCAGGALRLRCRRTIRLHVGQQLQLPRGGSAQ